MIDDSQLAQILRRWPVARLATTDAAGLPHVVPVVFCLRENTIYSPIDGKPKASTRLRRLKNLEDNPSASLPQQLSARRSCGLENQATMNLDEGYLRRCGVYWW